MSELDPDIRSKLLTLWEIHGSPESSEIPLAALISEGIDLDDYETWVLDVEDEKRRGREILADAKKAEAQDAELRKRGMEPMPPKRTKEETAAIERRYEEIEERNRRRREREEKGEVAEWLPDEDDDEKPPVF